MRCQKEREVFLFYLVEEIDLIIFSIFIEKLRTIYVWQIIILFKGHKMQAT